MTTINGLQAPSHIMNSIQNASAQTGVDFSYLVQQAKAESAFDANAKAKTSSATGLFQFIERTWLDLADKYGEKYGLEGLSRQELLAKRKDPEISSLLAAELASENKQVLEARTKGDIGATELYFAHFLGAGKAAEFVNARQSNGADKAAYLFPEAAKANKAVFFNKDGSAKTLDQVYAFFDKKFQDVVLPTQAAPVEVAQLDVSKEINQSLHPVNENHYTAIPPERLKPFSEQVQRFVVGASQFGYKGLNLSAPKEMQAQQMSLSFFAHIDHSIFEKSRN
ncbi:MAG: hypothetical protein CMH30_01205 [Micavibrio sp.]|nr:hypothetical protein [Micavibrio sp.]|tara:strand:- start:3536 stop:4378 length:843 start_codon:yes stop_codon:yes gene_type:complete